MSEYKKEENGNELIEYQRKQEGVTLTKEDIEKIYQIVHEEMNGIRYEMNEIRYEMNEIRYEMNEIRDEMNGIKHDLSVIKRGRGTVIIAPMPSHVRPSLEEDNGIEEDLDEWFRYK